MTLISLPQPNGRFSWTQAPFGRVLICGGLPARHVFTSGDLHLRQDAPEWTAVASFLDLPADRLLLVNQVHGTNIAVARCGDDSRWRPSEADIILSDDPDVAVGVRVADCAPILILDARTGAAGAVHAGWRGAAARAAERGLEAMNAEFGSRSADLIAAIGPCLGQCCGEVGPEVVEAFRSGGADDASIARWFAPGVANRFQLDLARASRDQLIACGVERERIFVAGLCTKTWSGHLHSYRAAGPHAGRMVAAIRPQSAT
jgi:polyphenol oxidase